MHRLHGFSGTLQADAYAGFGALYQTGSVHELACWAHALRKFHDLHTVRQNAVTEEAVLRIGAALCDRGADPGESRQRTPGSAALQRRA